MCDKSIAEKIYRKGSIKELIIGSTLVSLHNIKLNLVSTSELDDEGYSVGFGSCSCKLNRGYEVMTFATKNVYRTITD